MQRERLLGAPALRHTSVIRLPELERSNNALQQTRHGSSGASLLDAVLARPN